MIHSVNASTGVSQWNRPQAQPVAHHPKPKAEQKQDAVQLSPQAQQAQQADPDGDGD